MLSDTDKMISYSSDSLSQTLEEDPQEDISEYSPLSINQQIYYRENVKLQPKQEGDKTMRNSKLQTESNKQEQEGFQSKYTQRMNSQLDRDLQNYKLKCQQIANSQQQIVQDLEMSEQEKKRMQQENEVLTIELRNKNHKLKDLRKVIYDRDLTVTGLQNQLQLLRQQVLHLENHNIRQSKYIQGLNEEDRGRGQQKKFCDCVLDMVSQCNQIENPNLKQAWKWLKHVFDDYVELKKQETQAGGLSIRRCGSELRSKSRDTVQISQFVRANKENIFN